MRRERPKHLQSLPAYVFATLMLGLLAATVATAAQPPIASDDPGVREAHQMLTAFDGQASEYYGSSVDVDGNRAIVGARGGNNPGSAYVYVRSGNNWILEAKLLPTGGSYRGRFGYSVALDGDTAIIGAPKDSLNDDGDAFIFVRTDSGWTQQAKISFPGPSTGGEFGTAVALDGDTAAIGAPYTRVGDWGDEGSAYVFRRSGSEWIIETSILAPHPTDYGGFGISLDVDGDILLIGSPSRWIGDEIWGTVYAYERSDTQWNHEDTIVAPDEYSSAFARSISLEGTRAVIGSPGYHKDLEMQGCVYVYSKGESGWTEETQLFSPMLEEQGYFGGSVSLCDDTLLISAYEDVPTAYVFQRDNKNWVEIASLAPESASEEDVFGIDVSTDGESCFVGAFRDNIDGEDNQGSAYAFSLGLSYTGGKNLALVVDEPGVLKNDTGVTGSLSATLVTPATHGTVTLAENGGFLYEPNRDWVGTDSFLYRAFDGDSYSETTTVRVRTLNTGTISGRVVSTASDLPLGGIVVRAVCADDSDPETSQTAWTAVTDLDGTYVLSGIPIGRYHLSYIDLTDAYRDMHILYWGIPVEYSPYIMLDAGEIVEGVDTGMVPLAECVANRFERLAGSSRYTTAIEISRKRASADVAILVSGTNFPDALSASALAGAYDAPILLSPTNYVPEVVLNELDRLGVEHVLIVGGTAAISDDVMDTLGTQGMSVQRIWGSDRYKTSREVVRHLVDTFGVDALAYEPFIARGDNFADALAGSPFAWRHIRPVILVKPSSAPQAALDALEILDTDTIIVLGGTGAVSDNVILDFADAQPSDSIYYYRIAGNNRYDTAARVSQFWGRPYDEIGLASGANFPDALSGGPMMGRLGGALLLTKPTSLASETKGVLGDNGIYLWHMRVLGGEGALSNTVMSDAATTVGSNVYDMDYLSGISGLGVIGRSDALDNVIPAGGDWETVTLRNLTSAGVDSATKQLLEPPKTWRTVNTR